MSAQSRLLTPTEVAEQLGVPVKSLYVWRTKNGGPRGIKVGKHLRYRQTDLDAWIESQADKRVSA